VSFLPQQLCACPLIDQSLGQFDDGIHIGGFDESIHPWVALLEARDLIHKTTHQTYAQFGVLSFESQERGDPSDHLVLGALADDAGIE
jgi:hypothetical protein